MTRGSSRARATVALLALAACHGHRDDAAALLARGDAPGLPPGIAFGMTIDEVRHGLPELALDDPRDGRAEARVGRDRVFFWFDGGKLVRVTAWIDDREDAELEDAWGAPRKLHAHDDVIHLWTAPTQRVRAFVKGPRRGRNAEVTIDRYLPAGELLSDRGGRLALETHGPLLGRDLASLRAAYPAIEPDGEFSRIVLPPLELDFTHHETLVVLVPDDHGVVQELGFSLPYASDLAARQAWLDALERDYGAKRTAASEIEDWDLGTSPLVHVAATAVEWRVDVTNPAPAR